MGIRSPSAGTTYTRSKGEPRDPEEGGWHRVMLDSGSHWVEASTNAVKVAEAVENGVKDQRREWSRRSMSMFPR